MSWGEFSASCQAANACGDHDRAGQPPPRGPGPARGLALPCVPVRVRHGRASGPGSSRAASMVSATATGTEIKHHGRGQEGVASSSTSPGSSQAISSSDGRTVTMANVRPPGSAASRMPGPGCQRRRRAGRRPPLPRRRTRRASRAATPGRRARPVPSGPRRLRPPSRPRLRAGTGQDGRLVLFPGSRPRLSSAVCRAASSPARAVPPVASSPAAETSAGQSGAPSVPLAVLVRAALPRRRPVMVTSARSSPDAAGRPCGAPRALRPGACHRPAAARSVGVRGGLAVRLA